jgi:hypothetical protein
MHEKLLSHLDIIKYSYNTDFKCIMPLKVLNIIRLYVTISFEDYLKEYDAIQIKYQE